MHGVTRLQIISERRGAERAVTFTDQEFRRIPAVVAADVGDDKLREGLHVLVDPVEVLVFRLANGVAVTRAHGVDEDQVGLVEETFAIVHEFVGSGRRKNAVYGVRAPRPERAHVQPHGGGAGSAVVKECDRARGQILDVAACVRSGVHQTGGLTFFVFEQRGAGRGFVGNGLRADLDGVLGYRRFFLGSAWITFVRSLGFRGSRFPFRRLRHHARRRRQQTEKSRQTQQETLFHRMLPLAKCDGSKATDPAGLYVAPHEESKEGAAPRSTHNRRLSRSTKARDIRPRSDGSCLLTENAVWPFQSCITLSYEGDDKKKTSPRPDTGSFLWTSLTF